VSNALIVQYTPTVINVYLYKKQNYNTAFVYQHHTIYKEHKLIVNVL